MNERIDELGIDNLKIVQNPDYFCFGTDSVLLANFAVNNYSSKNVLDLCSGSGVVPIIFQAKNNYNKIMAVELQDEMYDLLTRNISINNLDSKIYPIKGDVCNIKEIRKKVEEITNRNTVDIITVNPPYKEKGTGITSEGKVKYIAKHEEKCTLEDIFKTSSSLLENKGKLYIVHKPERLNDLISVAREYKLEPKKLKLVYPNIGSKPSIVLLEYVKGGGNELNILKPLYEYDEKGKYTDEMNKIYNIKENINE